MAEDKPVVKMKAISVKQPWAWALFNGKDGENRKWRGIPKHRGATLIHASSSFDEQGYNYLLAEKDVLFPDKPEEWRIPEKNQFEMGGVIGVVNITDVVTESDSPWFEGPAKDNKFLVVADAKPLDFHKCKGKLNFFDLDYPGEIPVMPKVGEEKKDVPKGDENPKQEEKPKEPKQEIKTGDVMIEGQGIRVSFNAKLGKVEFDGLSGEGGALQGKVPITFLMTEDALENDMDLLSELGKLKTESGNVRITIEDAQQQAYERAMKRKQDREQQNLFDKNSGGTDKPSKPEKAKEEVPPPGDPVEPEKPKRKRTRKKKTEDGDARPTTKKSTEKEEMKKD